MKKPMLHDLLVMELQDLYDAEQQILDALPQMMEEANDEKLKAGFEKHLGQTEDQVARLEKAAELLDMDLEGEACEGMQGLVSEGEQIMDMTDLEPPVYDLALISAAQKVEHYEIASYGTAITLAKEMGHTEVADLLKETIDEEEKTDKELTTIAENIMKQLED